MKRARPRNKKDPTLREFFAFVREQFETNENRLGLIEKRIDARSASTNDRMDSIDARLGDMQRKLAKVEGTMEDIQDDLTSALHAIDNDGEAAINHERRIQQLEKLNGIKSVPPKHLAGLQ